MRTRRLFCVVVAVGALIASAAASAENVLRWASQGDALTMDPHSQNEGPTIMMSAQIYEALIARTPTMELEPSLATSWKPLDETTWEFKLREGVTFHEGQAFTAEDVVFSFGRAKAESSDMKGYIEAVTEIKAVDDFTVHLITAGPTPILPNQLTNLFIMDKDWAMQHGVELPQDYKEKEETYAVRNANGTGPFKLEIREPDTRTVLVLNENWWGLDQNPHNVDRVVYTPVPNAATRVAALLSGELDFVLDPPLQDLNRIDQTPGLRVVQTAQDRTIFLGMDQAAAELRTSNVKGKNPLADKRVRQAMYQAIDISAIQKKVMRGLSVPAGMITAPAIHGNTQEQDTRLPYDPEAARKLLAEAGYPDGFEIRLDCPNNRYNNDEAICVAVVSMLAKIGVKVNLEAIPKSQHFPKIQKRTTDFYMLGWGVPTLDSQYVFGFLLKSSGSWNATGYSSSVVDDLAAKMAVEVDADKRTQIIDDAWTQVREDIVYLPLHHQVIAWGLSDKIDMPIVANDSPRFRWARFK